MNDDNDPCPVKGSDRSGLGRESGARSASSKIASGLNVSSELFSCSTSEDGKTRCGIGELPLRRRSKEDFCDEPNESSRSRLFEGLLSRYDMAIRG